MGVLYAVEREIYMHVLTHSVPCSSHKQGTPLFERSLKEFFFSVYFLTMASGRFRKSFLTALPLPSKNKQIKLGILIGTLSNADSRNLLKLA